jgi:molybdenum cofactor cytidylyltransferase
MIHTFGVIPAAGLSRRMGQPKLALPLGDRTILEHVVSTVRQGGVDEVLVVLGPATSFLQPLAEKAGAQVCVLPGDTPDMRATMEGGLAWLERQYRPEPHHTWLLLPADHPTLTPAVVRTLRAVAESDLAHSIFVPEYGGKRGHPTLLRWHNATRLQRWPLEKGLNEYIRAHADETCEIHWPNDDVLFDLDTPEDYERLLKRDELRRSANGG